jgi:hypothetical protein
MHPLTFAELKMKTSCSDSIGRVHTKSASNKEISLIVRQQQTNSICGVTCLVESLLHSASGFTCWQQNWIYFVYLLAGKTSHWQ